MLTTSIFSLKKPQTSDPVTALRTSIGDNSDALEAIIAAAAGNRGIVPVGFVGDYAGAGDPSASWLIADGRSLLRASYTALFSIIGTTFGAADGTHFNLPDTRGRVTVGAGAGSGLTARTLAATFGEEAHVLSIGEMPSHVHHMDMNAVATSPFDGSVFAMATRTGGGVVFDTQTLSQGSSSAHNNMQPSLVLTRIIRVL